MLIPVSVVTAAGSTATAALPVAGVTGWWSADELDKTTLSSTDGDVALMLAYLKAKWGTP